MIHSHTHRYIHISRNHSCLLFIIGCSIKHEVYFGNRCRLIYICIVKLMQILFLSSFLPLLGCGGGIGVHVGGECRLKQYLKVRPVSKCGNLH